MLKVALVQSGLHVGLSHFLIHGTKHKVHLFQSLSFSFLKEDSDEDTHASAEASEHDECLPANRVDGTRSNLSDNEVEQPLGGSSKTHAI